MRGFQLVSPSTVVAFLILLLGLSTPATAVELELSAEIIHRGSPTTVELQVSDVEVAQAIDFTIDGQPAGSFRLGEGTHQVTLNSRQPASGLTLGSHRVEASSAGTRATTEMRILPGWVSIIPPLVAIGLALLFRNVLPALFAGVFVGAWLVFGSFWQAFARTIDRYVINAITDSSHATIIVFSMLLGAMVAMVSRSGGTQGIIDRLAPYATDARRGQVATWLMGILVFFDDYANTLIVGSTMRPVTDRLKISREKLAYIVDSTAAPVVAIFPISTWVGFEVGLIGDALRDSELAMNPYTTFLSSIPYRFYPLLALAFGLAIAVSGRDFGAMWHAERRARKEGKVLADDAAPLSNLSDSVLTPPEGKPHRASNALIPILVVIVATLVGLLITGSAAVGPRTGTLTAWLREVFAQSDPFNTLLWASLAGLLAAIILALSQRILSLREAADTTVEGFRSMVMAFTVLTLAWSIGAVSEDLHTADFLIGLTEGVLSPRLLPTVVFALAAVVAFATGTSWGVMSILTPLSVPLAHGLAVPAGFAVGSAEHTQIMVITVASVLAGSVWGDHCSPISDTTILSSMATGSDHIAHVRTQLPYALGVGMLAVFGGILPASYGVPPWILLAISLAVIVLVIRFRGRLVES